MSHLLGSANAGRFQDGVVGMAVGKGSGLLNIVIKAGIGRVGGKEIERLVADEATDIAVPTALGKHMVYANAPGALDAYPSGSALATFTVDTFEADKTRAAINGSVSTTYGRSIPLAEITVTAPSGTITLTGVYADGETHTSTINGTAVITTFAGGNGANATLAAATVAAKINADATVGPLVTATSALGVVTITAKQAIQYTLVAAETATAGTTAASAGTLTGGGISATTGINNTVKLTKSGTSYSTRVNAG